MATDQLERARKPGNNRGRKRLVRIGVAMLVGGLIGYVCPLLPEDFQGYCHLAAKIIGFVLGSP